MQAIDFLGSLLVVIGVAGVLTLVRFFFNRSIHNASGKSFPYHRQLVTFAIVLLGLFLAVALLPLDPQLRGQILSVLGVLLSAVIALSSTTLVGNAMAGIMLRLMHEFRSGDFIEVDQLVGRVTDFGIFHTEMQLITRDIVSIPNLLLVQRAVKVTRRGGTFINVALSIGYAVPHQEVEEALCEAAQAVSLTDPFVFVEKLFDHAVQYRLYGLLEEFSERLTKTSDLHKAILDTLHGKGIEIASPSISDRRELERESRYIPQRVAPIQEDDEAQSIEELAFDKAEEAESIEQLRAAFDTLSASLAETSDGKKTSKRKRQQIEQKMELIEVEIKSREKQKKEKAEKDRS